MKKEKKKTTPSKKRAEKYDPKLKIDGSFEDVIRLSVTPETKKEEPKKPTKKK